MYYSAQITVAYLRGYYAWANVRILFCAILITRTRTSKKGMYLADPSHPNKFWLEDIIFINQLHLIKPISKT